MLEQQYKETILDLLDRTVSSERDKIETGAAEIAASLQNDGFVHAFGSGHSAMIAKEITGRAGGLVPVNMIVDPAEGMAERVEGYGATLLQDYADQYGLEEGEVMIVISTSGRNPAPLEIALEANDRGLYTIAITSVQYSQSVESRHSSGKKLFEVADLALDNHVPAGDATVEIEEGGQKAGPASTLTGVFLINTMILRSIEKMKEEGFEPPILRSMNLDGSDEHNRELMEKYKSRLAQ
ncbi:MAG: sugar isomerase domain-containing protein [Candidatus Acetothermia bacterium]